MTKLFKNFLLLFSISTILTCCGKNAGPSWVDNDDYPLEFDGYVGYKDNEELTNQEGSMSYQIFVRSFYDHDGDGTGDLLGVKDKIPYLASLGIKTLWLLPIHKSPTYHGYDVSDYCSINPDYGTLDDFDLLVETAKESNIDIMIDMVFNHTSTNHPWFNDSYNDYRNGVTGENSKADWYVWGTEPLSNYHRYGTNTYYYGYFGNSMPDLNLDSTSLRKEIDNICKFWIKDHGVKGFRLDAILHYYQSNVEKNNEFLGWLSSTTKKYDSNFYMVGEAWTSDPLVNQHMATGLDSCFRFGTSVMGDENLLNLAKGYGNIRSIGRIIENNEKAVKNINENAYSSYFISNHDMDRPLFNDKDHPENSVKQAKALASLYCLLPGTPFMYYGEEIQLVGKRNTSPDDQSDVKRRLPMVWSKDDKTGECTFPEKNRKDLDNTVQVELGVDDQLKDPSSLLNHYREVINIRNKYPILKHGVFTSLYNELEYTEDYMYNRVFAYKITLGDESVIFIHNLLMYNTEINMLGSEILDSINVDDKAPSAKDGKLRIGAFSSVILKA